MITDIPDDYKIEHDRLIYEMEPIVTRLWEITQELPKNGITSETIGYNGFEVVLQKETK